MKKEEIASLEAGGFRVGTVAEFLELTPEENEMVELKVALANLVRELRRREATTQAQVAARIGTDQSRISRLEKGEPSVTVDQMLRVAFALGATRRDISEAITA